MAASISLKKEKNKKEITDCGICSKTLEDPRMLECFHTFCLKCLKGYEKNKSTGAYINCPLCKKEFKIPADGFDGVPVNHFVSKLIQVDKFRNNASEPGKDSAKNLCEQCLLVEQNETAVGYCVQCSEHMCRTCLTRHNKSKLSSNHKTTTLDEKPNVDELMKMTSNNCQNHPNNLIEAYCSDCKATLCTICMHTGGHKEHNCMDIKKAAAELSKKTYEDAIKWSCFMNETNEIVKLSDSALEDLVRQLKKARSGIKGQYEKIKLLLDKHYQELNQNLDQIESERKRELERMRDEGKQEMLMLESLERHWNEVKARGSDCDVVQAAISLQNTSEQTVKQHEEKTKTGKGKFVDNHYTINYAASDTFTASGGKNLLGTIEERCAKHAISPPDWNRLLNSPNVQNFKPGGDKLYDVEIHNNEVYMTDFNTPYILVYSLQNLSTVSRQISVPGLTNALGLVYNEADGGLYTSSCSTPGHIYKINTVDNSVTGWSLTTAEPEGLSISKQNNLLVSYYNSGQIDEFNGSGQLIRSIKLSDGITAIFHSIELKTGEFIVCQREPLSRICLVDSSGKVIKSYGKEGGSGVGQLNNPYHIELDQRGNILVSDRDNNKLRVLTSDLKYVADINITDSKFECPTSSFWDKENDRLLVTTRYNGFYVITPQTL